MATQKGPGPLGHRDQHHPHHRHKRAPSHSQRPVQSPQVSTPAPVGRNTPSTWQTIGEWAEWILFPVPMAAIHYGTKLMDTQKLVPAVPASGFKDLHEKQTQAKHSAKKHGDLVKLAFEQAQKLGWIPFFQEAAKTYGFTPELLMGIGYRESRLNPIYLKESGDNGHGYGIMQIDIRAYPDWVASGKWKNAQDCVNKGAEVLSSKKDAIDSGQGKTLTVKTLAGQKYEFVGAKISGDDLLRVAVAAYNCGLWAYYHFSKGHDIDRGTTGKDYSRDVLEKTQRFAALLAMEKTKG